MAGPLGGSAHPIAGRYVLADRIGVGAMGSVWRAYDLRTERWMAAKLLTFADGALLLRFVREQAIRIDHPHVLAPVGWAAEDERVVLVMDLVRGGTLRDLIRRHGPLPAEYVATLVCQLLEALSAIHRAGVVHRDVTPANVLLEPTGRGTPYARLGDFGVATPTDVIDRVDGPVGTPGYAAPERATSPRQDIYSLGRLGLVALAGGSGEPPDSPLASLLRRWCSPEPQVRPPDAAAALAELRLLGIAPWQPTPGGPDVTDLIGDPPTTTPARPSRRDPRPADWRPLAAAVCFAASAGLSAAALVRILT